MYNLSCVDGHHFSSQQDVYVLDIQRLDAGLAAISSDQKLSLFNPARLGQGPIKSYPTSHGNLTCLKTFDWQNSIVCTAGENGEVSVWDMRESSKPQVAHFTGRDVRAGPTQRLQYDEVHSDDVTELRFHPSEPHILLSGSTDGLVNIYDTRISDEDEVVIQTLNQGSVHHASFLGNTEVYVLTHDEKLAVYSVAEDHGSGAALVDFGDARETLGCQYIANVTTKIDGSGAIVGAGSQDRQLFELVHLSRTAEGGWGFDRANSVGLPGGHGEEIVRSFCFYDDEQVVFTAGEDGNIKAWRPN
ncbi:putative WD repeat-containing protein C63.06 [Colletotrichum liriopes]|uniref:WD repeat-containing protein C63.06 n=1 Tax=Colletotrichum liriopes TaxID=708192 RepID=A0AA37GR63_9PEZI|nr:putative WD repeat-containing protein C63.06 [Colletotrichum liriopes]